MADGKYGLTRSDEDAIPGQFTGMCWRCWPKLGCKCPPDETEVEKLKSERFIAEKAWEQERKRRRDAEEVIRLVLDYVGDDIFPSGDVMTLCLEYRAKYAEGGPDHG